MSTFLTHSLASVLMLAMRQGRCIAAPEGAVCRRGIGAPFEIDVELLGRRALVRFPDTRFDERRDELELILRLKNDGQI